MDFKMEKPWWMTKKNEPATNYDEDYDISETYYGQKNEKEEPANEENNGYENYEDGDVSEVSVAWSEEDAKAVAKANEPLKKRTFTPSTCHDSQAIVDAFKEGRVIIICVEELNKENFLRLFDYVMGAVHALDGKTHRIDRDTVAVLPYGVDEDIAIDELEEEIVEEATSEEDDKNND